MAKKKPKLKYGRTSEVRHVRLYHWMLKSPAFESLSVGARSLLVEIMKRHNGLNNGEISFSQREAGEGLGCSKNTATKWFWELENKGFIVATQRGSFHQKVRHATTWRLTMLECDGKQATKDFMRNPSGAAVVSIAPNLERGPTQWDRRVQHAGQRNR